MAKRNKAIWTPKDYTQFFLIDEPTHTPKEIRAEYSRIRDITQKRANRLEKAGLKDIADFLRKTMPKLSELKTTDEVKERLAQGYANYRTKAYSLARVQMVILNSITGNTQILLPHLILKLPIYQK